MNVHFKRISHILLMISAFSFVVVTSQTANAQDFEEDLRFWGTVIGEGKFNQSFGWYLELQGRLKHEGRDFDQAFFRPAVNYWLSDKTSLWLGYVAADTKTDNDHSYEKRYWQQLMHRFAPVAGFGLLSRTRLEQRDLDTTTDMSHRLRQMLRVEKQLWDDSATQLLVMNEVFINLNNTQNGPQSGFDQNRLFLGAAIFPSQTSRLELGYINQYVNTQALDRMNHVVSATLFLRF